MMGMNFLGIIKFGDREKMLQLEIHIQGNDWTKLAKSNINKAIDINTHLVLKSKLT